MTNDKCDYILKFSPDRLVLLPHLASTLPASPRGISSVVNYIRSVRNGQSLTHVVIGYQHSDPAFAKLLQNSLNIDHRNRIDSGERLVQQNESRARSPGTCAISVRLRSPPDKLIRLGVTHVRDVEFAE